MSSPATTHRASNRHCSTHHLRTSRHPREAIRTPDIRTHPRPGLGEAAVNLRRSRARTRYSTAPRTFTSLSLRPPTDSSYAVSFLDLIFLLFLLSQIHIDHGLGSIQLPAAATRASSCLLSFFVYVVAICPFPASNFIPPGPIPTITTLSSSCIVSLSLFTYFTSPWYCLSEHCC